MAAERSDERAPSPAASGARWCFTTAAVWVVLACGFGLTAAVKLLDPGFMAQRAHHTYPVIRTAHTHSMLIGALLCAALGVTATLGDPNRRRPARVIAAVVLANVGLVGGLIAVSLGHASGVLFVEMPAWAELLVVGVPIAGVLTAWSARGPDAIRGALLAGHAVIAAAHVASLASPVIPRIQIAAAFTMMSPHVLAAAGLFLVAAATAESVHRAIAADVPGQRFAALVVSTLALGPFLSMRVSNAPGNSWIAWIAGAIWCVVTLGWALRMVSSAVRHASLAVTDVAWRHVLLGLAFLSLLILQSTATNFPALRDLLASTDVRIAHAHLGLAGVIVPWLLAGAWHALDSSGSASPRIRLAGELGFWCLAAGIGGMVFSLLVAGVAEAQAMTALAPAATVLASARDAWWMRLASGAAMTLGIGSEIWALHRRTRGSRWATSARIRAETPSSTP